MSTPERDEQNPLADVLSGVNADEVVTDPDELEPEPDQPPAATPDSPNPI